MKLLNFCAHLAPFCAHLASSLPTGFVGFTTKTVENVKFGCFNGKFKENYKQSSFYETVLTVNEEIIIEWSSTI